MPRSSYHHGDLHAALLVAGRQALHVGRLESLSLREISRTVGVTPTAVYRHFRDKDELLEALAMVGYGELRAALRAGLAAAPSRKGRLASLVTAYRAFAQAHPDLMKLMFRPRAKGGRSRAKLDEAAGECLAEFVAAVAEDDAGREPEAAIRAAVLAWSAVHGLAMLVEANAFVTLDPWMLPKAGDLAAIGRRDRR